MKIRNFYEGTITIILLFFSASCSDLQREAPYIMSVPEMKIEEKAGYYRLAGIEFDIYNMSGKEIKSVEISCFVYSAAENKNVLTGSNKIESKFIELIPSNTSKRLAISLDSRLYKIPNENYLIDFLTVPEIRFTDGSVWKDSICQFYTRSY